MAGGGRRKRALRNDIDSSIGHTRYRQDMKRAKENPLGGIGGDANARGGFARWVWSVGPLRGATQLAERAGEVWDGIGRASGLGGRFHGLTGRPRG